MHAPVNSEGRAALQEPSTSSAEKFAVTTFKQRDQWSRMLPKVCGLKLKHRDVLRSLALCARLDDNAAILIDPTYYQLADAAGCGRSTAIRAVNVAEEIGIIRKKRHSDGRVSNAFELLLPVRNGVKFPVPTVSNLPDAEGSNGVTADTVLSVERKEELEERVPSITNSESAERRALSIESLLVPRYVTPKQDATPIPAKSTDLDATVSLSTTNTCIAPGAMAPDATVELEEKDQSSRNGTVSKTAPFPIEAPEGDLPLRGVRAVSVTRLGGKSAIIADLDDGPALDQLGDATNVAHGHHLDRPANVTRFYIVGRPEAECVVDDVFGRNVAGVLGDAGSSGESIVVPPEEKCVAGEVFGKSVAMVLDMDIGRAAHPDLDETDDAAHLTPQDNEGNEAMYVDADGYFPKAGQPDEREAAFAALTSIFARKPDLDPANARVKFDRLLGYRRPAQIVAAAEVYAGKVENKSPVWWFTLTDWLNAELCKARRGASDRMAA